MQEFDNLFLLSGKDLRINDDISVKHPTISEIVDIGEYQYHVLLNPFVTKPEDYMVEYDDIGINYLEVDPYHQFYELFKNVVDGGIDYTWLLGCSKFVFYELDEEPVIMNRNGFVIINRDIYSKISLFLKKINNYPTINKYNPSSELTRKAIIENEREEKKDRKNQDSQLANFISAVAWKDNGGINILNIWNLHIYQFFDAIQRISSLDNYRFLMQGIYSGCIDAKSIPKSDLNWIT
jgi:hypothetical protein